MAAEVKQRVLPPSFDEAMFDEAMDALAAVVGSDNVSRDSSHGSLEGPAGELYYGDVWPLGEGSADHTPSGAVRPKLVEEVQEIVKVASRYKLPLWTISRGKNLGRVLHLGLSHETDLRLTDCTATGAALVSCEDP